MSGEKESIALRACPTLVGHVRPLIAQLIPLELCETRQRELYHKCHRCVFRGRPASEVTERLPAPNGKHPDIVVLPAAAPARPRKAPAKAPARVRKTRSSSG